MSMTAIRTAFIGWVTSALNLSGKVVWADQDMPKLAKPFVTLRLTAFNDVGHPVVSNPDANGAATGVGDSSDPGVETLAVKTLAAGKEGQ